MKPQGFEEIQTPTMYGKQINKGKSTVLVSELSKEIIKEIKFVEKNSKTFVIMLPIYVET